MSRRNPIILALSIVTLVLAAGCVAPQQQPAQPTTPPPPTPPSPATTQPAMSVESDPWPGDGQDVLSSQEAGGPSRAESVGSRAVGVGNCRPPTVPSQHIREENLKPGNALTWTNVSNADVSGRPNGIKGYASPYSVNPGEAIDLRVSTNHPTYWVEVYRLGWYSGVGSRLVTTLGPFQGSVQPNVTVDPETRLVVAPWNVSAVIETDASWTTGVYIAKLVSSGGAEAGAPFIVRNPQNTGALLFHTNEHTWQAYNAYGGVSMYKSHRPGLAGSVKASMDRPYDGRGVGSLYRDELPLIRYMESASYSVDYASNSDMHADACALYSHRGVVSAGHDEYWTSQMRTNYEQARDAGVNLAFFTGNTAYWQIRLENSTLTGEPNRVIVCYRNATRDPITQTDPANVTLKFQDPALNRTPLRLLGLEMAGVTNTVNGPGGWYYNYSNLSYGPGASRIFRVAPPNGSVSVGVIGHEWEAYPRSKIPPEIVILAQGKPTNVHGQSKNMHTIIYRAPSGAWVFSAGTVSWSIGLEPTKGAWIGPDPAKPGWSQESQWIRLMTDNVLRLASGDTYVLKPGIETTLKPWRGP